VVVDDFDLPGILIPPCKADSPLIVDPDTPLAFPIATKFFQPVSGRLCKFFDAVHARDLAKLAEGNSFDRGEPAGTDPVKQPLGFLIRKGPDHGFSVARLTFNVKQLLVPNQLGVDGFDAPEDVGFHGAHLADEEVGLLFVIEHHLVGDPSCAELFTLP
jgi:hypothetical protein